MRDIRDEDRIHFKDIDIDINRLYISCGLLMCGDKIVTHYGYEEDRYRKWIESVHIE